MHKVYELKEMLCDELEEYGSKGKLDVGDLDIVDKLSHTIKNLDKILDRYEEEEYSSRGMSYADRGRYSRMRDHSYERRMSRDGGMVAELREMMKDAPDDRTRAEFDHFIRKIEGR